MKTKNTGKGLQHLFLWSVLLCIFAMTFSFQAYAQDEELLDKTWFLDKLVMENDTIYNPTRGDVEFDLASTIYFNAENDGVIDFGGCPGEYSFIAMEFDDTENFFLAFGIGGFPFQYCSDFRQLFEGLEEFTDLYFYDFFYGYGEDEGVSIYHNIYNDHNSNQHLVLTNPDGYEAHYNSIFLSTPDFEELHFSLSPNPVQNQLFIQMKDFSSLMNLEVYDMQGRVINSFDIHEAETQLDVSGYTSGMYFVKLKDDSGNQQVAKFMKQ